MDSPFSLGVVIPCHKPYIPLLKECLDSIESQTVKPDRVIVACSSSSPEDIPAEYTQYSFPCEIHTFQEVRNQAQNRNYGVSKIDTDAVSFFDADDVMHPQRIEHVRNAIRIADIVFHSYTTDPTGLRPVDAPTIHTNKLRRGPTGCVVFSPDYTRLIHHAHVTVRKGILEYVRFPENPAIRGCEDSLFGGIIVSMRHIETAYIEEPLSYYRLRSE